MKTRVRLDTFRLVQGLQPHFPRQQAACLVDAIRKNVDQKVDETLSKHISRAEAENETFQYKVALQELKTELSTLRKTETAALQSASASIQRDLDILSLKFREDFNTMKSDIQLDMNSRKSELKEEKQRNELKIQEINHRLTIAAAELKAEVDSMKLQLLTKWASGIAFGTAAFKRNQIAETGMWLGLICHTVRVTQSHHRRMYAISRVFSTVSEFYKDLNPATLSGAIDVVVVERSDGTLHCSPFHVRFGKMQLLRPQEKNVEFTINGKPVPFPMKVGEAGEAFFAVESNNPVPQDLRTSPPTIPKHATAEMTNFAPLDLADTSMRAAVETKPSTVKTEMLSEIPPFNGGPSKPLLRSTPTNQSFHSLIENASSIALDGSSASDAGSELVGVEKSNTITNDTDGGDDDPLADLLKRPRVITALDLSEIPLSASEFRTAFPHNSDDKEGDVNHQKSSDDPFASPKLGKDSDFDEEEGFNFTPLTARDSIQYPFSDSEAIVPTTLIEAAKISGTFSDSEMDYSVQRRLSLPSQAQNSPNRPGVDWNWQWGDLPSKGPIGDKIQAESTDAGLDVRPLINIDIPVSFDNLEASLCGAERLNAKNAEKRFEAFRLEFEQLDKNPALIADPSLVLRINQSYYTFTYIIPFLFSQLLFRKPLSEPSSIKFATQIFVDPSYSGLFGELSKSGSSLVTSGASSSTVIVSGGKDGGESKNIFSSGAWKRWWSRPASASAMVSPVSPNQPMSKINTNSRRFSSMPRTEAKLTRSVTTIGFNQSEHGRGKQVSQTRVQRIEGVLSDTEMELNRKLYAKTLRLTSDQLKTLDLKYGPNTMSFTVNTSLQGKATCSSRLFFWRWDEKVVISDIDGTITKSDALGHLFTMVGKDWTHPGIASLYTKIHLNGYQILYLTSRAIGQADSTRGYLRGVEQGTYQLPDGPVIMSPDRLIQALKREVIDRRPEEFKIACLKDIKSLFGPYRNPFYAGFGNRVTDAKSYRAVEIPPTRIYSISSSGEVKMDFFTGYTSSYIKLSDMVDHIFPPILKKPSKLSSGGSLPKLVEAEEVMADQSHKPSPSPESRPDETFNDFNFWRDPLPVITIAPRDSAGQKTANNRASGSQTTAAQSSQSSSKKLAVQTKPRSGSFTSSGASIMKFMLGGSGSSNSSSSSSVGTVPSQSAPASTNPPIDTKLSPAVVIAVDPKTAGDAIQQKPSSTTMADVVPQPLAAGEMAPARKKKRRSSRPSSTSNSLQMTSAAPVVKDDEDAAEVGDDEYEEP